MIEKLKEQKIIASLFLIICSVVIIHFLNTHIRFLYKIRMVLNCIMLFNLKGWPK